GSATPGSAPFRVTAAGALTATSATISGAITATSGSITGAFSIASTGNLRSGSATDWTTGTGLYSDVSAGVARFRVGNPAGNRLYIDNDIELITDSVSINNGSIEVEAGTGFENRY